MAQAPRRSAAASEQATVLGAEGFTAGKRSAATMRAMTRLHSSILLLSLVACSAAPAPPPEDAFKEIAGTRLLLSVDADLGKQKSFFDQPYPSDLRLDATGHIDLRGLPNHASNEVVTSFRDVAMQAKGFPVIPVAWFRFDAPIAAHDSETVIAASPQSPTLLVDCDASSEENGRLFPTVAQTLRADDYLPENVLAVAPRPGFVLKPHRRYGFVVLRALNDAAGAPLGVPAALAKLLSGKVPEGTRGQALADLDAPLWPALQKAFPLHPDGGSAPRGDVEDRMQRIHVLRNRIAHHEPVFRRNLQHDFGDMLTLVGWISVEACDWVADLSRVESILGARPR